MNPLSRTPAEASSQNLIKGSGAPKAPNNKVTELTSRIGERVLLNRLFDKLTSKS